MLAPVLNYVFEEVQKESLYLHAAKLHRAHYAQVDRSHIESDCFQVLISSKNISCIDLILHIIKTRVVAVGDDGVALGLELFEVIDHFGTEECRTVLKRGLVDYDLRTFGLDAFHHALDRALAEVV